MSNKPPVSLKGIFPPIPTPFSDAGEVDYENLRANLNKWNQEPLAGYVVLGSNGEYVYLSLEERLEAIRVAREVIPPDRLLITGSGMEGTRETIFLTRRMAKAGADVAIVVTPNYYKAKMTGAALRHHYQQVADASPIPVMLYNVPMNTGIDLPAEVVTELSKHPNIIGIKESSGNLGKLGLMAYGVPEDFQILVGSASGFLGGLALGAVGGVMALANIAAAPLAKVKACFEQGDLSEAATIQRRLIPTNVVVTARFGIPGLKTALDMLGYYGGPVRSPLLPLAKADQATLREVLSKGGLLS